jgi:serine protease Do
LLSSRVGWIAPVLLVGWWLGPIAAGQDVRGLDRRFREVAAQATPATVLVKSTLGDGRAGFGSGALISADGSILTCAHVIDTAADVEVTLADGETFAARVLGRNPKQDYALLKIEMTGLPHFDLGDSEKVKLGDWVIALGHPGGPYPDLKPAFSVGRVTGLHRRLPVQAMDRFYDDAIRTDAPIFAGNSGGPLLDLDGKLIGLNGAILLVNENSYAVPMAEIARNLDRLKQGEHVEGRSADGTLTATMDEFEGRDMAKFLGRAGRKLFGREGIGKLIPGEGPERDSLVRALEGLGKRLEGEGAQRAIEKIFDTFKDQGRGNGGSSDLPDLGELRKRFGELFGGGEPEPPPPPRARAAPRRPIAPRVPAFLGIVPEPTERSGDLAGVRIAEVIEGSPAAAAGIQPGEILVEVARTRISSEPDLPRALGDHSAGERVPVKVLRSRVVAGTRVFEAREVEVVLAPREEGK